MSNTFFILLSRFSKTTILKIFILSLIMASCAYHKKGPQKAMRLITDMNGREVQIPLKIKSAIAHHSGALRMVCYLDAADIIVGVEANEKRRTVPYLFAYPELRNLPIIGSGNNASPELIAAQQPDVLICTYLSTGEADELQEKTGVPVVCLDYGDFNEHKNNFYNSLRLLGNVLDKEKRANYLIDYIEKSFEEIESECSLTDKQEKVYIGGIAFRGSHGINSTEPMYAPFRFANTINVSEVLAANPNLQVSKLDNVIIDKEQIIEWNPDKIFIDISGYDLSKIDLEKESVLGKLLPAVQKNEIYFLFPHIWHTINYEHILINTFYIAHVLHPELYPNFNIKKKANEVYKTFLGKAIYDDLLKEYKVGFEKITRNE